MKIVSKIFLTILLSMLSLAAHAYEVATHEEMSSRAADASVLGTYALSDIGLGTLDQQQFSGYSIRDWIRDGANHEDDVLPIARFRNHFYNPLDGSGYHYLFLRGEPSPTWSLEDTSTFTGQQNSWTDLLGYYYSALTDPDKNNRDLFFVSTFSTLGHVMHLIEDAAQPQHTRNDSHGTGSLYEKVTNDLVNNLPYGGYGPVNFDRARSFWYTVPPPHRGQEEILAGRGIAEYSNRNFVTTDTNFRWTGNHPTRDPGFPLPDVEPQPPLQVDIRTLVPDTTLTGDLFFYGNTVVDSYQPSGTFNQFATTLSIFDADLKQYLPVLPGQRGLFTLNRFNFYHAHPYLIPRAVGYSAGLINYFFRGRLETNLTEENGFLKFTVKNISGPGKTLRNGTFEAYYDSADGTRKPLTITSGATVDNAGIIDGSTSVIMATTPGDVDASSNNPFVLAFTGVIGTEKAVVGKVAKIKKSGLLYVDDSDNRRIQILTKQGTFVSSIDMGDLSYGGGGLTIHGGLVYVTTWTLGNFSNGSGFEIRTFSKNGDPISSFSSGRPAGARLHSDLAVDDNWIYIAHPNDSAIGKFTKSGSLHSFFGSGGPQSAYYYPFGIAIDATRIYVADYEGARIHIYDKETEFLISPQLPYPPYFGGLTINSPHGLAVDDKYLYVTYPIGNVIKVLDKNTLEVILTFGSFGSNSGQFSYPLRIAVDDTQIYVADTLNHRVQIFTKDGAYVTQFGVFGSGPGQFRRPAAIAVD